MNQINTIIQDTKEGKNDKIYDYEIRKFVNNPNVDDNKIPFIFKQHIYREKYYEGNAAAWSGEHRLNAYEWAEWGGPTTDADKDRYYSQAEGSVSHMWWK